MLYTPGFIRPRGLAQARQLQATLSLMRGRMFHQAEISHSTSAPRCFSSRYQHIPHLSCHNADPVAPRQPSDCSTPNSWRSSWRRRTRPGSWSRTISLLRRSQPTLQQPAHYLRASTCCTSLQSRRISARFGSDST